MPGDPRAYIAPRCSNFREHLDTWAQNAERRVEARPLAASAPAAGADVDLEITLFDVIGVEWWEKSLTAQKVDEMLRQAPEAKRVRCLINSPGGYLHEGVAIYNLLKRHPAHVEMEVVGECASAATVVMMAGDRIVMRPGTISMVHPAWACACGDETTFEHMAEYCRRSTTNAIDVYQRRTGRSEEELRELIYADKGHGTWMTAQETVDHGFADAVDDGEASGPSAKDEEDEDQEVNVNINITSAENHRPKQLAFPLASNFALPETTLSGIRWVMNSSRPRA